VHRLQRIDPSRHAAREALPDVLGLARYGINIRRGQVTMIAAQPSVGKSVLAIGGLAIPWARLGIRSLYFSADSDEMTVLKRAAASVTGQTQQYVERSLLEGRSEVRNALAALKGGVAFSFETDPTYQHLNLETLAFYEAWGEYPQAIFIDNLMDVVGDNEDEFGSMRDTSKALKRLARQTDAAIIALHHCTEQERLSINPPSRREITGKVSQKAELIITLGLDDEGSIMRIAPVKNRDGKQDRGGTYNIPLRIDFERVRFSTLDHQVLGAA
jgi:KaiC/GvpD/RAD55 family RecA-like ATPase